MEQTEQVKENRIVKFPIAAIFMIFLTAATLFELIRIFRLFEYVFWGDLINVTVYRVAEVVLAVLIMILLFMRKRNGVLFGAFLAELLLNLYYFYGYLSLIATEGMIDYGIGVPHPELMWTIGICGYYLVVILFFALLVFETIAKIPADTEPVSGLRKRWWICGILGILMTIAHTVANRYFQLPPITWILTVLFIIPFSFTLSYWLTHPYKKQRMIPNMGNGYMPPNGQPMNLTKTFCTECGRQFHPTDRFCPSCGAKR